MRGAPSVARGLGVLTLALVGLSLGLLGRSGSLTVSTALYGALPLGVGGLGVWLALRRPQHPLGWVLAVTGVGMGATGAAFPWAFDPVGLPGSDAALRYALVTASLNYIAIPVVLLLYPDGRLPSRRWRPVLVAAVVGPVLVSALVAVTPDAPYGSSSLVEAVVLARGPGSALAVLCDAAWAVFLLAVLASAGSLAVRYARAPLEARPVLRLVGVASGVMCAWFLVMAWPRPLGLSAPLAQAWGLVVTAWLLAVVVTIVRHRLLDLDVVVNRTLVSALLIAFVVAVHGVVVLGIGRAAGGGDLLPLLAAGIAAVGFAPVRDRAQRLADRVVYGRRATPYEVLAQFSRRVTAVLPADTVLPSLAEAAGRGVGAAWVEASVALGDGTEQCARWPAGARGNEPGETAGLVAPGYLAEHAAENGAPEHVVLVRSGDEVLGRLRVGRQPGRRLAPVERRLLEDLASQAAPALRVLRQAEELRAAAQRIVAAQDAERRRLERDIHDGVQQRLVAVLLALRLAEDEPAGSLAAATGELETALAELRELARGIHPAVLTQAGLGVALESLVSRAPVAARLLARPAERLPAEVEAAAYFVVSEALANAAKHAPDARVSVVVTATAGTVRVEVSDDGAGGAAASPGGGLEGLADRVAALHGTFTVDSPRGRGTRLVAELPVRVPAARVPA